MYSSEILGGLTEETLFQHNMNLLRCDSQIYNPVVIWFTHGNSQSNHSLYLDLHE